jgi:hypothetical protein
LVSGCVSKICCCDICYQAYVEFGIDWIVAVFEESHIPLIAKLIRRKRWRRKSLIAHCLM